MLLYSLALAATPPSLDDPLVTGARAKKDFALVVSMEDYKTLPDVDGAKEDADLIEAYLLNTRGVPVENFKRLENPTRQAFIQTLQGLAEETKKPSMLWVYFVGHGAVNSDGERVLLTAEASTSDTGIEAVGLTMADVTDIINNGKSSRNLVIIDAAFSGKGRDGEAAFTVPAEVPPMVIPASDEISFWYATSGAEHSMFYTDAGHSLFTYLTVGALRGWSDGQLGDGSDGKVTVQEAEQYVARVLKQIGGPELKSSRESRGGPNGWLLTAGDPLDSGPSKDLLAELARQEKARRVQAAEAKVRVAATAVWQELLPVIDGGGPASQEALRSFIARYDVASAMVDGVEMAVVVPEVAEARAKLDAMTRTKKRKGRSSRKKKTVVPEIPVETLLCMDLEKLESTAVAGQLNVEQATCLEARMATETLQTSRDKISRLLMVNADAAGNTEEWLSLAARHLEDIDRSDPDLCFKYALVLSRGDVVDGEDVLRWADYALENKHVWDGPLYMSRVYNLYRLKAETATRMWHDSEQTFIEERDEASEDLTDKYRGMAKNFSREWLDYARSSGQPFDRALQLCLSAAGNEAFCPAS